MKKGIEYGLEKTLDCFHKDKIKKNEERQQTSTGKDKRDRLARWSVSLTRFMSKLRKEAKERPLSRIEQQAKWRRENPEKARMGSRRRRARKVAVNENYTAEDEAFTKNLFDHACFNCGSTENLSVDHYRPLSKGNALTLTNAIILCRSCNCSKGPKDPEQFFSEEQIMIIQEVFDRVEEIYEES